MIDMAHERGASHVCARRAELLLPASGHCAAESGPSEPVRTARRVMKRKSPSETFTLNNVDGAAQNFGASTKCRLSSRRSAYQASSSPAGLEVISGRRFDRFAEQDYNSGCHNINISGNSSKHILRRARCGDRSTWAQRICRARRKGLCLGLGLTRGRQTFACSFRRQTCND